MYSSSKSKERRATDNRSGYASGSGTKPVKTSSNATDKYPLPYSFLEERWLFLHITGHYPREAMKKNWNAIAASFRYQYPEGQVRSARSLEAKWDELMVREVTITYFNQVMASPIPEATPAESKRNSRARVTKSLKEVIKQRGSSPRGRSERYSKEQIEWLVNWASKVPAGKRRNWRRGSSEFKKKFGVERTVAGLHAKFDELKKKGMFPIGPGFTNTPNSTTGHDSTRTSEFRRGGRARNTPDSTTTPDSARASGFRRVRNSAQDSSVDVEKAGSPSKKRRRIQYSQEQETWLLDYIESTFEGIELNELDWEVVSQAFEEEWGIKRNFSGLVQKWERLMGRRKKSGRQSSVSSTDFGLKSDEAAYEEAGDNEADDDEAVYEAAAGKEKELADLFTEEEPEVQEESPDEEIPKDDDEEGTFLGAYSTDEE
ncbi:hypothetical protein RUND412_008864 [Rhizina undulata]